ncbi:bis(5'-nucleosyl)-tetraphosphatase [Patescibacteria group bacterium]
MREHSFGIIPIFKDNDNYQVLLLRSKKYGHWMFPKGRGETGEDSTTAAKREFEEETGIKDYFVIRDLELNESWDFERDGQKISKTVKYYLGFVRDKKVKPQAEEVTDYRWVDLAEAEKLIKFENKKEVLRQVGRYLAGISLPD